MARDAVDPQRRVEYKHEQKLWLQIAEQIEGDERTRFEPEPE
jgi:hypothetical protein